MAFETDIQWCDSTSNPVMGCEGCELATAPDGGSHPVCYAWTLHELRGQSSSGYAPEFFLPTLFRHDARRKKAWLPWQFAHSRRPDADLRGTARPEKPWLDGLPRLIFLSDMADALSRGRYVDSDDVQEIGGRRAASPGKIVEANPDAEDQAEAGVPFEFLESEIINAVESEGGRRHQWLWLTKLPQRMAAFCDWLKAKRGLAWEWPENLWAGTSVTAMGTLWRIDELSRVGGAKTIRFVSAEPLFQEVSIKATLERHPGRWWVIAGGESRQSRFQNRPQLETRETKLEWLRKLRDECATLGVPFFLKQLGGHVTENGESRNFAPGRGGHHHGDWSLWPGDLLVRQLPIPPEPMRAPWIPEMPARS